jgi:hypothetical protein
MAIAVVQAFESAAILRTYILSMVLLGRSPQSRFQSAFQTMGWNKQEIRHALEGRQELHLRS